MCRLSLIERCPLGDTDLCQYFGHKNLRFYAAIAIAFSIGFVRSKNASIASAGIL